MDSDDFISIGRVKKTNGIQGELKLNLLDWNYSEMNRVRALFFKQYDDLVPFIIEDYRIGNNNELYVKLDDVDVVEDALKFVHLDAFIPKDLMKEMDQKRYTEHEITGYKVVDLQYGDLGYIAEITANSMQKMLLIENGEDEILIPFVDEMVRDIDYEAKTVTLDTPEGLIDLNNEDEAFIE